MIFAKSNFEFTCKYKVPFLIYIKNMEEFIRKQIFIDAGNEI